MVDFNLLNIRDISLTIEKPVGKAIFLKLGEIVKAQIADILPSGLVNLKIKGELITAKTSLPITKGFSALLKVTSLNPQNGELKLQFIEYADKNAPIRQNNPLHAVSAKESVLTKLISELARSISNISKKPDFFQLLEKDISKLQRLNSEIFKSLPQEIKSLPKDTVLQLKSLLQTSLKITGQTIQSRLENLITNLPEGVKNHPIVANISSNLLISMDKLLETPMKNILHDTGVLLEAKLRAIAELIRQTEQAGTFNPTLTAKASEIDILKQEASTQNIMRLFKHLKDAPEQSLNDRQKPVSRQDLNTIKNDLKAGLLQLRQIILNKSEDAIESQSPKDFPTAQKETTLKVINTLIKDIETFQLLSKTTDSFYTFIPVSWKEIRDGNLAFKKGKNNSGNSSYSCRINLELERFGRLSTVILMVKGDFYVSFNADNAHLKSMIEGNSLNLQESFRTRGLNLKTVNVMDTGDASIDLLERFESLENLVNIKI
jgi:hypothetical protein